MKLENNIGWTDCTINSVTGCDKVSPGCKNCYASVGTRARVLRAQGVETWGPSGVRHPVNFETTFRRLNKLCICNNCHEAYPWPTTGELGCCTKLQTFNSEPETAFLRRIRLFADSNSDWLDPKWPIETLARFLDAIRLAPNIDVLLLTKRIGQINRLAEVMSWMQDTDQDTGHDDHPESNLFQWLYYWIIKHIPPTNVWLGVSAENQKYADERIPKLLSIPAAVRFVSAEPLLEHTDIRRWIVQDHDEPNISWVIVGAESGKDRRDCGVEAIISVAEQCVEAGVPVYAKQDCAFKSGQQGRIPDNIWALKKFPSVK